MPKATFDNLPADKRQRIIDLAIAEFAEYPYASASISRIVAQAGIAKGSLYQYFEHKKDLFLYLIDYAAQRQLAILRDLTPPQSGWDFFQRLRWQMSASTQVGLQAPQLVRLMQRAVSPDLPFYDEVQQHLGSAGTGYIVAMVAEAVADGELAADVDVELVALMIRGLTNELGGLIAQRIGVNLTEGNFDPVAFSDPAVEQIYDNVIRVLQYGLAPLAPPRTKE